MGWADRLQQIGWKRLCRLASGQETSSDLASLAILLSLPLGTLESWDFRVWQAHDDGFASRVRDLRLPSEAPDEPRHLIEIPLWHDPGEALHRS